MDTFGFPDEFAALWFLVRRVAGLMDRQGEALFRAELDVSLAQFLVLSVVDAHPGDLNQQVIADRLGLTKGTVSRQIDRAVQGGLMTVQVAAHTRRENSVALTPAGTELVRNGDRIFQEARDALLERAVDPADMAPTLRLLSSLLGALERPV